MHRSEHILIVAFMSIVLSQPTSKDCCAQKATLRGFHDTAAKYEFANSAFEQKEYTIAAQTFAEIANSNEDDGELALEARYWLAESFMRRRLYRQAQENYRRYLKISPSGHYAAWASLRLGQTAKRLGDYAVAERAFHTYLTRFAGHDQSEIAYRCLLYTSPSPRDATLSRMPSSA